MAAKPFDPAGFWQERLADNVANLNDVGHRSLGMEYNAFIYRRRTESLDRLASAEDVE